MKLQGLHHVTAVSSNAKTNKAFYSAFLGMRLVKKTVNQDDVTAYHLFYADGAATPGSDLTFFEFNVPKEDRGTNSIIRTALRVASDESLNWWEDRFDQSDIKRSDSFLSNGRRCVNFEDNEGQRLSLLVDSEGLTIHPWTGSSVPNEHQIIGLGPVTLSVSDLAALEQVLTRVMQMEKSTVFKDPQSALDTHVYKIGGDRGSSSEIFVVHEPSKKSVRPGAGGVHHVAFRTPDEEQYFAWNERLNALKIPKSGPVNRYYFQSLYFREPNGILFEIATDGPGFAVDEPIDQLGNRLALPPFLEPRRAQIEARLQPL